MWDLVLSVVLQLVPIVSALQPSLEITFPEQHSYWQVSRVGQLETLPVYFHTHHFRIPQEGYLFVTGDTVPDEGYRHISHVNSLFLGGIDPGTHFWSFELRSWNESAVAEVMLHVEVVVDVADDRCSWRYQLTDEEKRTRVLFNPKMNGESSVDEALPVCYVSSTTGAFDGQKRMWLQIMEGLSAGDRAQFQFEVKTFEHVVTEAPLTRALQKLNVSLHGLQLEIPRNELSEEEATRDGVVRALLSSFYRQFPWAKYDSGRVSRLDQPALLNLRPTYAARVWNALVDSLRSPCADGIIIFSNSRRLSDELLVLASRLAGTRAVIMELANLYPPRVDVDILLAPSHFAKNHYSVATNVRARSKLVMSTGVNTEQFAPSAIPLPEDGHFIIGYVGRLSSEKSLGLLLAAMKILAPICSRCMLRVIGDGPNKSQLKTIATEWGLLGTSITFVDGIYNDEAALEQKFREMHVFASPMFTETLGVAVLEAMSVGIPVVGFISAGTSEFLEDGRNCVSVPKATPAHFADTILSLVNNFDRRARLGRQARYTVMGRFSTRKLLEQYAILYERAGRSLNRTNNKIDENCASCTEEFGGFDS
ncbi:hypothetical protein PHMEG_0003863 [Phytophthora megakarya]|uniref:Uncharacterized protein n=1 Tax=Phytophthora megakarya TaxID=4795 RepID=A0A225WVC0_9STRA|nr:hypothetical protein PHMEG_0003863 [Phytophthora megakarya]